MTIPEFLARLETETATKQLAWTITTDNLWQRPWLRLGDGSERCPMLALAGRPAHGDFAIAGQAIGLSDRDICALASAADGAPGHDPALRDALMDATWVGFGWTR